MDFHVLDFEHVVYNLDEKAQFTQCEYSFYRATDSGIDILSFLRTKRVFLYQELPQDIKPKKSIKLSDTYTASSPSEL